MKTAAWFSVFFVLFVGATAWAFLALAGGYILPAWACGLISAASLAAAVTVMVRKVNP